MRVETASRAPHARKHGATFAESWTLADGATLVAVGAVLAGGDSVIVSDLLRTGARAVLTSRNALAFARGASDVDVAGAGQLHAALIDGSGAQQPLHGHAAALGTGLAAGAEVQSLRLRRDDLVAVATVPLERAWWDSGDRSAAGLLQRSGAHDGSVAVVALA